MYKIYYIIVYYIKLFYRLFHIYIYSYSSNLCEDRKSHLFKNYVCAFIWFYLRLYFWVKEVLQNSHIVFLLSMDY